VSPTSAGFAANSQFVYPGEALKRKHTFSGRAALSGAAAATLILAAPDAGALGLGRLAVQSALGETLQAEIEVTSMSAEEAANLRIRVAPPEAYRAANVEYNAVLPGTRATLQRRPDGRQFVRLTSDRGVQEPFVDVILEISWATGRLVREYTLLFDPPTMARAPAPSPTVPAAATRPTAPAVAEAPAAAPMAPPPVAAPRPERRIAAAPSPAPAPSESRPPSAASAPSTPSAPSAGGGADEYRVRPGDSLSRIASKTQRPGVSLDQMLVALFRTNPQAFISNNMNRLKSGAVLAVPTADAAQQISVPQAREVITAQSADFGAYRQRLAGNTMPATPEGSARQSSGKVQAAVEDRKQAASPTPDRLTLSKGTGTAAPSVEEERLIKEREKQAAEARVKELEKNVGQLEKLAKSGAGTATAPAGAGPSPAAPNAATAPQVVAQATPPATPAPAAAPTPPAAPASAPAVSIPTPAAAPVTPPAASAPAVAAAASPVAARPAASAVAVAKPSTPAKPAAAERDLLGSMMDDNPLALGVGALLVALLAGFGIYRVTQRAKKNSGETSFLESRLQPDSFFGASGGQRIDTRDAAGNSSSMTYSLSQLDAIGDVDPVAEADVYLAYGRDLQAEEILKEAMRSSPERLAIRTKLLEVYAKRRDTKGFELLATQLYGLTRGEGEDWAKAQEMGADIDPGNAMYQPGGAPANAVRGAEFTEPLSASTQPHLTGDSQFGQTRPSFASTQTLATEVDLDLDDPEAGSPSTRGTLDSKAFAATPIGDLDAFKAPATPVKPAAAPEAAPVKHDEPLAFDMAGFSLDLDPPATTPKSTGEHVLQGVDLPSLDLTDDGDPMMRKLELAEEFRQIGDKDGARDLLREVLAHASGVTKTKAQNMLDDLG
jgi:pilus assembly protein FimV